MRLWIYKERVAYGWIQLLVVARDEKRALEILSQQSPFPPYLMNFDIHRSYVVWQEIHLNPEEEGAAFITIHI